MPPNSVNAPFRPLLKVVATPLAGSTRPTAGPPKPSFTNQRCPSAPAVIATTDPATGVLLNSVIWPAGVTRPRTVLDPSMLRSANQPFPSGPALIDVAGPCSGPNSVASRVVGLYLPIRRPVYSVNQRLPSGPVVIAYACDPGVIPVQTMRTKLFVASGGVRVQVSTAVGPTVTVGQVVVM